VLPAGFAGCWQPSVAACPLRGLLAAVGGCWPEDGLLAGFAGCSQPSVADAA